MVVIPTVAGPERRYPSTPMMRSPPPPAAPLENVQSPPAICVIRCELGAAMEVTMETMRPIAQAELPWHEYPQLASDGSRISGRCSLKVQ